MFSPFAMSNKHWKERVSGAPFHRKKSTCSSASGLLNSHNSGLRIKFRFPSGSKLSMFAR